MFDTLRLKWRIMRDVSALVRWRQVDDFQRVLKASFNGLSKLGDSRIDRHTPWSSSTGGMLLWAYCEAATHLGLHTELFEMLSQWRPTYLEWMKGRLTPEESKYFAWFEEVFQQGKPTS